MTASTQAAASQQLLPSVRDNLGNITVQKYDNRNKYWSHRLRSLTRKLFHSQHHVSVGFGQLESTKLLFECLWRASETIEQSIDSTAAHAAEHDNLWTRC
jgi:hypothetical protein